MVDGLPTTLWTTSPELEEWGVEVAVCCHGEKLTSFMMSKRKNERKVKINSSLLDSLSEAEERFVYTRYTMIFFTSFELETDV